MSVTFKAAKPTKRYMGVDPSTKTGLVVVQGNEVLYADRLQSGAEGVVRLQSIAAGVLAAAQLYKPDHTFIEGLAYGNRWSIVILSQLRALICDRLVSNGFQWWDVPPKTLKKYVTGSGKADKKQMAKAIENRWGVSFPNDDVADAYGLARLGQAYTKGLAPTLLKGVVHGN